MSVEGKNLSIEHRIVPYCLFTDPQLGSAGLTEKEARAKGYKLKIGSLPMSYVARAIERDETAGLHENRRRRLKRPDSRRHHVSPPRAANSSTSSIR